MVLAFWSALLLVVLLFPKGEPSLYINQFHIEALDYFFFALTFLGDGLFAAIFLITTMLFVSKKKSLVITITFLSVVVVIQVLKHVVFGNANRPYIFFEGVSNVYYIPWLEIHKFNSFPSGHTAQAFCLALCTLFYMNNKAVYILFSLALLTGFSRIYLMQHFPMDVLAGSVIAVIVSTLVFYLLEYKIAFFQRAYLDTPFIRLLKQ